MSELICPTCERKMRPPRRSSLWFPLGFFPLQAALGGTYAALVPMDLWPFKLAFVGLMILCYFIIYDELTRYATAKERWPRVHAKLRGLP